MKKRLLAAVMTGMMALSAIMATPLVTSAQNLTWDEYWYDWFEDEYTDIPIVFTTTNDETEICCLDGAEFSFYDKEIAAWPDEFSDEEIANLSGTIWYYFDFDTNTTDSIKAGDVLTLNLPYAGTMKQYAFGDEDGYDDYWSVSFGTDSVTFTCLNNSYGFWISLLYQLGVVKTPEGNFWFEPMENELAIAASEVSVNGGTATAKISGDYALSYDIMKWLEDHPGVTLEYTLTYEGNEYLIVIPGGSQLADTNIPWYGPKYLIKYFAQ